MQRMWMTARVVAQLLWLGAMVGVQALHAAEESVVVLPHWGKGEKVQYEMVKTRQKVQGGLVTVNGTTRTKVEIEVMEAGVDGFVLGWTFRETQFDDPLQRANPLAQKMTNLLKDSRIILELDDVGTIKGVRNWEALKDQSTKVVAAITGEMKAAGADPATIAKVQAQVNGVFATKQQVEQLSTREVRLLFLPLGIEFKDGKPVEYQDMLPNVMGGDNIPSRARFELTQLDRKRGTAKVNWNQAVVPEEARRIMEQTVKEMAQRMGKPIPEAEQIKSFTIQDVAEFNLELPRGWTRSMIHKRTMKTDGASQEDTITFERKDGK